MCTRESRTDVALYSGVTSWIHSHRAPSLRLLPWVVVWPRVAVLVFCFLFQSAAWRCRRVCRAWARTTYLINHCIRGGLWIVGSFWLDYSYYLWMSLLIWLLDCWIDIFSSYVSVIGPSAFISMYRPASCSLHVSAFSTHVWLAAYTAHYFISCLIPWTERFGYDVSFG